MGCTASRKKIILSCLSIVLGVSYVANALSLEANIGLLLSLTGTQAFYGKEAKNGIELALDEIKNSDLKIKIAVEDSQSSPSEAAKGMNKLITSDKVFFEKFVG